MEYIHILIDRSHHQIEPKQIDWSKAEARGNEPTPTDRHIQSLITRSKSIRPEL